MSTALRSATTVAAMVPGLWRSSALLPQLGEGCWLLSRRQASAQSGPSSSSGAGAGAGAGTGAAPAPPKPAGSPLDAFTANLQHKTEQELLALMQAARERQGQGQGQQAAGAAAADGEEEEEDVLKPNPVTGEIGGPKGKEPTRYGDWDIKGKCVDF
ncbi:hypothetical protein HYH03_015363 [Edaphochlamys debaryana]|uniref:Succinate dehydrogenase assembly factor 4, mitochondrial n=1 Tax=Edaphochlamys debaryana TaxID=47281 RepID=A0A836BSK7_9CHLO|nr:hypothetical protein HYH03_015363 [Edaphochlamys debaryana]|eukprot:KAG2485919.1 hypothetical protein HYH03_015363 [Edaphochlamys debaryana]